jgi:hypothetical protein
MPKRTEEKICNLLVYGIVMVAWFFLNQPEAPYGGPSVQAPSFHDVGVGSNRCHFSGIDRLRSDQYHASYHHWQKHIIVSIVRLIAIGGFDVMRSGVGCWYITTLGIGMPAAERRGEMLIYFATSNATIKSNKRKGILTTSVALIAVTAYHSQRRGNEMRQNQTDGRVSTSISQYSFSG